MDESGMFQNTIIWWKQFWLWGMGIPGFRYFVIQMSSCVILSKSLLAPLSLFTMCKREFKEEKDPFLAHIIMTCEYLRPTSVKYFESYHFLARDIICKETISPHRRGLSLPCLHHVTPSLPGLSRLDLGHRDLLFWKFELRDLEPESGFITISNQEVSAGGLVLFPAPSFFYKLPLYPNNKSHFPWIILRRVLFLATKQP